MCKTRYEEGKKGQEVQSEHEVQRAEFETLKMVQFKIKLRDKVGKTGLFLPNMSC